VDSKRTNSFRLISIILVQQHWQGFAIYIAEKEWKNKGISET
jgi:hypothetical protein